MEHCTRVVFSLKNRKEYKRTRVLDRKVSLKRNGIHALQSETVLSGIWALAF